ncbi:MAG: anthranilate synthase component I family protein [Flavobacteriales bacterium]|nr:anthranilate synthase component I family protein [Flavobacteriales bacterium]
MRLLKTHRIFNREGVKRKLLQWAQQYDQTCVLESNALSSSKPRTDQYGSVDCMVAVGAHSQLLGNGTNDLERLKSYVDSIHDWAFGYLSYDLKNQIEALSSNNADYLKFPDLHFFQPELIFELGERELICRYLKGSYTELQIDKVFQEIMDVEVVDQAQPYVQVEARLSRQQYMDAVEKLKGHIAYGDIYEVNFCQEYFAKNVDIETLLIYERLNEISKSPFANYYKNGSQFLMSASPERFMRKRGNTLISQPIKGTSKRGESVDLDALYKQELAKSKKERSENVMIVDIVRNDLARSAVKGTVTVEDLFGIYTFEQVHQMISTVKCNIREDVHPIDAIKDAFPMGSMTGAPKIRAMQLIEDYESTKRGLYSGAVGYITPEKDFDFNVVIRSILYNAETRYLSLMVGGAITDMAEPEEEYEECLVKAKALFDVLAVREPVS